ncbi:type ISP restriction/modification enzyme [Eikenella corrodens]|uniref:type ISP restriction/modification enzyme n=1 Tax=Eikenella corrodens TaxID=539 RepID=UPI0030B881FC
MQQRAATASCNSELQQRSERQPIPNHSIENLTICLTVTGSKGFSVLMTNTLPDLHLIGDAQCFPMFLYETEEA